MVAAGQAVGLSPRIAPAVLGGVARLVRAGDGLLAFPVAAGAADQPRYVLWTSAAAVITLLLLMAVLIAWLERWRKRADQDKISAGDQLAHFRELYERGELSPEEFARVRTLLGDRLKEELDLPTATPEGDSQPEPPPAPPKG
jgi:hypothetical protein